MSTLTEIRAFVESAPHLDAATLREEIPVIQASLNSVIDDSSTDEKVSQAAQELRSQLQEMQAMLMQDDFSSVGDDRDVQPLTNGNGHVDEKSPSSGEEEWQDTGAGLGLGVPTNGHARHEGREHKGEDSVGDHGYDPQDDELSRLVEIGRAELASVDEDDEDLKEAKAASLGQEYKRGAPRRVLTSDSGQPLEDNFDSLAALEGPLDWESLGVASSTPTINRVYEIAAIGKKFFSDKRIAVVGGALTGAGWLIGGLSAAGLIFGLCSTMVAVKTIRKYCPPPKRED